MPENRREFGVDDIAKEYSDPKDRYTDEMKVVPLLQQPGYNNLMTSLDTITEQSAYVQ